MTKNNDGAEVQSSPEKEMDQKTRRRPNWFRVSVVANIIVLVVVVLGLGGVAVIHQSDTNPNFCGLCHVMQSNVTSYQTSNHLDNVHKQAGVQCKDCHDYPVTSEMLSGVKFLLGQYVVTPQGDLAKRQFSNNMCLQCHISYEHNAVQTASLARNPHDSHNGSLPCADCHISHGAQVDYCAQCHENGGQKMIEQQPAKLTKTIIK